MNAFIRKKNERLRNALKFLKCWKRMASAEVKRNQLWPSILVEIYFLIISRLVKCTSSQIWNWPFVEVLTIF